MRVEVKSRFKWSGVYTSVTSGWDGFGRMEGCGRLSDVFLSSTKKKERDGKYANTHTHTYIHTRTYMATYTYEYINIQIHIRIRTYILMQMLVA